MRARIAASLAIADAMTFIGVGLAFAIAPRAMAGVIAIDASATIAAAEIRAIYGGLEIAAGVGVLWLVGRGDSRIALTLLALLFAGLLGGRGLSLALDGVPASPGPLLAGLESLGLAAALVGRRLAPASRP